MKRHAVVRHTRTGPRGQAVPVRQHIRGMTMASALRAPFESVKLYKFGRDKELDFLMSDMGVEAFVPFPDGYVTRDEDGYPIGPKLDPRAVYLVSEPTGAGDLYKRVADTLAHETLHHVLGSVEGWDAAEKLDTPYDDYRARHGNRHRGGI